MNIFFAKQLLRKAWKFLYLPGLCLLAGACKPEGPPVETPESKPSGTQNWTNYIRTAGHGLNPDNIDATIADARETGLFGIEVDNDIPGRYESFLDPGPKLEALRQLAAKVHEIDNYAFVYVAGLECITQNADQTDHSFFKDHPDWVQRDITQRPAKFGGGDAFWIREGDEDVWISPYAPEWRKQYMQHIRQIAKTGIDGIFVDIPYWMTHFDGWEHTWASFDAYTVQAFKEQTGIDATTGLKLGDFGDENFRKWVDFRMNTLTEFLAEIDRNAKSVNPDCMTIAEIYPNAGEEAVRVGADVYAIYDVVDVIAHEFSGGGGNATDKDPLQWFDRMAGMYTFRAFAEGKASLMLSYSWGEGNKIPPGEPMKNLALSNLMAGTNHWDARGHVMSGSNDLQTRRELYTWIGEHEDRFYKPRTPIDPVGIYFSPTTRTYNPGEYMDSFQGMVKLMLQGHMEFQILSPRTLSAFGGDVLVLPDVQYISRKEQDQLKTLVDNGVKLIYTGDTGSLDPKGKPYARNVVSKLLNREEGAPSDHKVVKENFIYYPECPGKTYSGLLKKEFDQTAWDGSFEEATYYALLQQFKMDLKGSFKMDQPVTVAAAPGVSSYVASVEGNPHVFLANFSGLKGDEVAKQTPQKEIEVVFKGMADDNKKAFYLPFLGAKQELTPRMENGTIICTLPVLEKGGVVWLERG
jgi:hypothetical protein